MRDGLPALSSGVEDDAVPAVLDADMDGCLRADVAEGDHPLAVQHVRSRDVPSRDSAGQALWHTTIIVAVPACPGRFARWRPPPGASRQEQAAVGMKGDWPGGNREGSGTSEAGS